MAGIAKPLSRTDISDLPSTSPRCRVPLDNTTALRARPCAGQFRPGRARARQSRYSCVISSGGSAAWRCACPDHLAQALEHVVRSACASPLRCAQPLERGADARRLVDRELLRDREVQRQVQERIGLAALGMPVAARRNCSGSSSIGVVLRMLRTIRRAAMRSSAVSGAPSRCLCHASQKNAARFVARGVEHRQARRQADAP